jgi:hypothetical protein
MKPVIPKKFIIALGIVLVACSFPIQHFVVVPDFLKGVMRGIGFSMVFITIGNYWYSNRVKNN